MIRIRRRNRGRDRPRAPISRLGPSWRTVIFVPISIAALAASWIMLPKYSAFRWAESRGIKLYDQRDLYFFTEEDEVVLGSLERHAAIEHVLDSNRPMEAHERDRQLSALGEGMHSRYAYRHVLLPEVASWRLSTFQWNYEDMLLGPTLADGLPLAEERVRQQAAAQWANVDPFFASAIADGDTKGTIIVWPALIWNVLWGLLGLAAAVLAVCVVVRTIARRRGVRIRGIACPRCFYQLTELRGVERCPECGQRLAWETGRS